MKKFLSILIIVFLLTVSIPTTYYASFITDYSGSFQKSEEFSGAWKYTNELGIIHPDNVVFEITAKVKSYKPLTYMAYISVDDATPLLFGVMKLRPGREEVKEFKLNIANGLHKVLITVTDGEKTVFSHQEDIAIMNGYEKQFMDEFEDSGIGWQGSKNALDELYMDLFNFAGFKGVRKTSYWSYVEKSKGVFDWSFIANWADEMASNDVGWNAIYAYGNGSVYPMWQSHVGKELPKNADVRMAPHTQEGIRAYANFGIELTKRFPGIANLEVWNEPNIGFWQSDYTKVSKSEADMNYEYPDLLKATTATIRGEFKNKNIGGLCFVFNGSYDEMGDYLDFGLYPYMNNLTYHFYAVSSGIDDSRSYENRIDAMEQQIIERGGWKPMYLTECGWHTGTAITTRDEDFIAENLPKLYTVCDQKGHTFYAFDFNDAGTNPANKEDNWGMIKTDGSLKKHYVSVAERNRQLNGGLFVGELNLDDSEIRAFVYLKQGNPVVMIWDGSKEREEHTITLGGEQFSVNDLNGTLLSAKTDTVTLTKDPMYLRGLSHKYIAMAAKEDVKYDRSLYAEEYKDMLPSDILAEADTAFNNAENALDNATEENIKASIEEFNQVGLNIINKFKTGEITDLVAARATYELSKTLETLCVVYMSEYDGEVLSKPTYSTTEAQAKADSLYRDDNRIMQYSDSILSYAVNTEAKAEKLCGLDYDAEDTKGYIAGWGLLTKVYCQWFDSFSASEEIQNYGLLSQVLPESRTAYVNENINIKINANNYSKLDFAGTLRLYDEDGKEITSSEYFELDPSGHKYIELPFNVQRYNEESKRELTISFVDVSGNRIANERLSLKVKDMMSAFVQPCTSTLDEMDSVDLKFTNLTDEELTFTLKVESDENYSFASNTHKVTMKAGEERIIELPITEITETKFHYYTVKYEAISEEGIVMAKGTTPLNFTAIVPADNEIKPSEFNGDISDWYDAYPIYINAPENPNDKSAWDNAEISARAFLKWDDEHLYLLIDAYDDVHYNYMTGTGIWDGDSMQISIDPKNTKSAGNYDSDDYELGMAIGGAGVELWAWQTPIKSSTGKVDFINIIRDDTKKITRYIAAFPKAELSGLELRDKNTFGMNIAINEADVLNREAFYQFTNGTADSKNPSLYADFTFTTGNKSNYIDGKAETLFPNTVVDNY